MPGHRRVKDIDYDDDEAGEYDDEYAEAAQEIGGMTAEDKEQLRHGTIAVREALEPGLEVSDKEIEESLWYYYFDVDKTLAYLRKRKTSAASEPKKQKQPSKFELAAQAAESNITKGTLGKSKTFLYTPLRS